MANPRDLTVAATKIIEAFQDFIQVLAPEIPSTPVPSQEKPDGEFKRVVKPIKETYNNDPRSPGYNPSPPLQPDPLPPPKEIKTRDGEILIAKGTIKVCYGCKKPVVMANKDIQASELGVMAFDILDKSVDWPNQIEVDKKGGVCVTCPMCGRLALWLVGGPEAVKRVGRDGSF